MKSTGENFGVREVNWLERSIQRNLDANGPDELYGFECELLNPNQVWIKIYLFDRDVYVDGVMGEVRRLTDRQLRLFLEKPN